jgi:hypothetical protein
MTETQQLLADYVENHSEAAFRQIVERYVNLVYSTALRSVTGDRHLAEDITQIVFIHLARKAHKLGPRSMIGGWLHRDTCFVASKVMRQERRRQNREREAALMSSMPDHSSARLEEVIPLLDQAINALGNDDPPPFCSGFSRSAISVLSASHSERAKMPPVCASAGLWRNYNSSSSVVASPSPPRPSPAPSALVQSPQPPLDWLQVLPALRWPLRMQAVSR